MRLASEYVAEVNERELNLFRYALRGALEDKPYAAIALNNLEYYHSGYVSAGTYDRSEFCSCHASGEALLTLLGVGNNNTKLGDRNKPGTLANFRGIMQTVGNRLKNDPTLVVWLGIYEHSITLVKTAQDKPVELFESWAGAGSNGFDLHENLFRTYLPGAHPDYWAQNLVGVVDDADPTRRAAGARLTVYSAGYTAFHEGGAAIPKLEVNMQPLASQETILLRVRQAATRIAGTVPLYAKMENIQGKLYAYGTVNSANRRLRPRAQPYEND